MLTTSWAYLHLSCILREKKEGGGILLVSYVTDNVYDGNLRIYTIH